MSRRKRKVSSKYQKLLPAATLAAFLLGSLFYVIFVFNPTIDLSINGRPSMKVRSRSEAEIEVYRELPYKATFQLSTGQHRQISSDEFSTYVPKFFCYSDDKPQTPSEILKEEQGIIYT